MIRAVIIDDEIAAIESLKTDLQWYCESEVEVLGFAHNLADARKLIAELKPDLVFLDVEIKKENGFMLLEKIREMAHAPKVIFTTGHSEYAISAIKKEAFDYLLKPIDPDELKASIARLKNAPKKPAQVEPASSVIEPILTLSMHDQVRVCKISEIVRLESERNYTHIHLAGESPLLISKTLASFEPQLLSHGFFRPHKSHLINLSFLKSVVREDGGYLLMKDGAQVPLARANRQAILNLLGIQ